MRTKLFGALVAALAIAAFAALPSAAMAQIENVTLKEGKTNIAVGSTVRATSANTKFKGRTSGFTVECFKTSIRGQVRTNPGARVTFREGGVFEDATGGDKCAVGGSGGRIVARVENVKFRKDILLQKNGPGGPKVVEGRTEARFTFKFFDPSTTVVAECSYDGKFNVTSTTELDKFKVKSEEDAKLEGIHFGSCDPEGFLEGEFRLTRRDGTTPVTNN